MLIRFFQNRFQTLKSSLLTVFSVDNIMSQELIRNHSRKSRRNMRVLILFNSAVSKSMRGNADETKSGDYYGTMDFKSCYTHRIVKLKGLKAVKKTKWFYL